MYTRLWALGSGDGLLKHHESNTSAGRGVITALGNLDIYTGVILWSLLIHDFDAIKINMTAK